MGRSRLIVGMLAAAVAVPLSAAASSGATEPVPSPAPEPTVVAAPSRVLPAEARADLTARRTERQVELTGLRSETAEVYANPDGTRTMQQHAQPVRLRRGSGWVAPDPTLRRHADGRIRPVATAIPIVLSGGGDRSLLAIGAAGRQVRIGWRAPLPSPVLLGATATYREVFPGVDLRVEVGVDSVSQLLVVKNRAAAGNPALRTVRYPVGTDGLRLAVRSDGSTVATDRSGRAVLSAPPATMWDASGRRAPVRLSRPGAGDLILRPDPAMLADPAARFPLTIDPMLSGTLVNWLHVNVRMGGQSAWSYDRNDEGAKVGRAYQDTGNLYRSMFLLNTTNGTATIAGSTIIDATFGITLNKTPSSTAKPVRLWAIRDLDPASYLDWATQGQTGFWKTLLDTRSGEAYPWTEDNPMAFRSAALQAAVQDAANRRAPRISLGLRAVDESTSGEAQLQWKKFHPSSAVLSITYNNAPQVPRGLTMTRPKPCGTAGAPAAITTRTPQFSAVAEDPDPGASISSTLQIRDGAGTVVHNTTVTGLVSGAAFSWPEVPAGTLADGVGYRYSAFNNDGTAGSAATPDCWFVIDSVRPNTPAIESADFPEGELGLPARTTGTVTFRPGGGDTDVAEYLYGFSESKMTMRVKAEPDGTARIPVTVWPDEVGNPETHLHVRAVDRAGNLSPAGQPRTLSASDNPADQTHVRGDSNGDGRADVTAVFDHGYGRSAVWNITSAGTGFHTGVIGWDAREGGGYPFFRLRQVQGDFNGDGRADLAMFREDAGSGANRTLVLFRLISDGNRYDAPPPSWNSGPGHQPLSTVKVTAGDVDGDGSDDIVLQRPTATGWEALVFRAADGFGVPVSWATSPGVQAVTSTPVLADVDGDQRSDLLSIRNLSGCSTTIELRRSTGTGFAAPTTAYQSGTGGYCWEKSKAVAADPDGDGKDDLVALYENPGDASLYVFRSDGTALTRAEWRRTSGLDLSLGTLAAGDFDADGKDDAAILYACCPADDRQLLTFHSTGTSFADKATSWQGQVDAVTGPKFDIEHRQYELVNKNSEKCLRVDTVTDGAPFIQLQCAPLVNPLYSRFRLVPIAGTDQYSVRHIVSPTTSAGMRCADVASSSDGAPVLKKPCGGDNGEPTANQQLTIQYVEGASYDTVVLLRFAHSGKCAGIKDASREDSAPVVQLTCGQGADQQWILRPAYNGTPLGENGQAKYQVYALIGTPVLEVQSCATGTNVRMATWANSGCQKWSLESLGDDLYRIVHPQTGKVLDITGCSQLPKTPVVLFDRVDTSSCQLWRIEPMVNNSNQPPNYTVTSPGTGHALNVLDCSASSGADVVTWFIAGNRCQRWAFTKVS